MQRIAAPRVEHPIGDAGLELIFYRTALVANSVEEGLPLPRPHTVAVT